MINEVLSMPPVLNIQGFWIAQDSEYVWFWMCQSFGYNRALNISLILNMPGFWIYQSSEYARVRQASEYAWLCLIMSGYDWILANMICVIMFKSAWKVFVLHFSCGYITLHVVTYLKGCRRLELIGVSLGSSSIIWDFHYVWTWGCFLEEITFDFL